MYAFPVKADCTTTACATIPCIHQFGVRAASSTCADSTNSIYFNIKTTACGHCYAERVVLAEKGEEGGGRGRGGG